METLTAFEYAIASTAGAGDALARGHVTPLGEMPGPVLAGFTILDMAVHGWRPAMTGGRP